MPSLFFEFQNHCKTVNLKERLNTFTWKTVER